MCGISGIATINDGAPRVIDGELELMSTLLLHRGPDDHGIWKNSACNVGLAHRRLSIIDLSAAGHQPMSAPNGTHVTLNGEIYNYRELKRDLAADWSFRSQSDTETVLAAYDAYGIECLTHLRGMFAFALWDDKKQQLVCARDRFGIKPLYYTIQGDRLYFASEIKALLPFIDNIETDHGGLAQYLTFQYTLDDTTLFKNVHELPPAHYLILRDGRLSIQRYWDIQYTVDFDHTPHYFHERLRHAVDQSIDLHLRADVPVGVYLSGGLDSSLISILAGGASPQNNQAFHGKFAGLAAFDESEFAQAAARAGDKELHEIDIGPQDFERRIEDVIYHLDQPIAGPGSFPQFMVSELAARHVKVVLGGQGGDEIFGGYARYLLAYFEQCIKAAIDGTYKNGNFVVTPESIIPNLTVLQEYKPLIKLFWADGLFEPLDARYFRLINRAADMKDEVRWDELEQDKVYKNFQGIFNSRRNVEAEAYFDSMTHFDFKCLLPALLHVEDRMSMAHGLESRVPFLDHPLVEFAATVPANVKFQDGKMKNMLKETYVNVLPAEILNRRDKMGFPVPLKEWFEGPLGDYVQDIFRSGAAARREFIDTHAVLNAIDTSSQYSRKIWGFLSLELWHRRFHDNAAEYQKMRRSLY